MNLFCVETKLTELKSKVFWKNGKRKLPSIQTIRSHPCQKNSSKFTIPPSMAMCLLHSINHSRICSLRGMRERERVMCCG